MYMRLYWTKEVLNAFTQPANTGKLNYWNKILGQSLPERKRKMLALEPMTLAS